MVFDSRFERAVASQAAMTELQGPIFEYLGAGLFIAGNTFVLSSMWALGVTGTYLGIPRVPKRSLFEVTILGFCWTIE